MCEHKQCCTTYTVGIRAVKIGIAMNVCVCVCVSMESERTGCMYWYTKNYKTRTTHVQRVRQVVLVKISCERFAVSCDICNRVDF